MASTTISNRLVIIAFTYSTLAESSGKSCAFSRDRPHHRRGEEEASFLIEIREKRYEKRMEHHSRR